MTTEVTVICDACKGSGLTNTETGNPESNAHAWRSDVDQCMSCDGMGRHTHCPLCAGRGCWDCDGGWVSGP